MRLATYPTPRPFRPLMHSTAIGGVLAVLMAAAPVHADVGGMTPTTVQNSAGAVTVTKPDADNLVVSTTAKRTLIDWNTFAIDAGQTATFNVNGSRDAIVLNRVSGGSATISGTVRGCMDASCTVSGGNIWLYARDGVVINGSATIDAGGFLATVSPITSAGDFLDPAMNSFGFSPPTGAPVINVGGTASFGVHGGTLALIAPRVVTGAGVTVTGDAGNSDVLYGAANAYTITFAKDLSNDFDLVSFLVPDAASGSASTTPLTLAGTTSAGRVFAAAVSRPGVVSTLLSSGAITATAISGSGGEVTLSSGYGVGPTTQVSGAGEGNVSIAGAVTAPSTITVLSTGAITQTGGALSGGMLTAQATYGMSFDRSNQMTSLGAMIRIGAAPYQRPGGIIYRDADDILLTANIDTGDSAALPNFTITSETGSIRQTGGFIRANNIYASAVNGLSLPGANQIGGPPGTNLPATLGTLTNTLSGGILYVGAGTFGSGSAGIQLGRISAPGQVVSLTATNGGMLGGARITAGRLDLAALGGIRLDSLMENAIDSFGAISAAGSVQITNTKSIVFTDDVTVTSGRVDLDARSGSIEQTGGVISIAGAGQLNLRAITGIRLDRANQVSSIDNISTTGGDIVFRAAGSFDLPLSTVYTGSGQVTLISDAGSIGTYRGNTVSFTGSALNLQAATGIQLTLVNGPDTLGDISTTAGDIYLEGADFVLSGDITTPGAVELVSTGTIAQTAGVITAATLSSASRGGATYGLRNHVAALGAFTDSGNGALLFGADGALALGGDISGWSSLKIQSDGDLTILATGQVTAGGAGDAVVLAANGDFINLRGANAVSAPGGRWLIYSQRHDDPDAMPTGNVPGGLTAKAYYGDAYDFDTAQFATAPNAGNRFVYGYQPVLSVTPSNTTVTYNGAIQSPNYAVAGVLSGDAAGDAWSGAPDWSGVTSKNVGGYTVFAILGSLASDLNYGFDFGSALLTVDPKAITGTATVDDKTYDGSTGGTGTVSLTGVISGDAVTAGGGSYTFADANAGTGKTVTVAGVTLGGADAGNYTLSPIGAALANIHKRAITVTADDAGKIFGEDDPAFTYMVTNGSLVTGDGFTGVLTRDAGESVGFYAILQGSLAASSNYDMTFVPGEFQISAAVARTAYTGSDSQRCAAAVDQCSPITAPTAVTSPEQPPTVTWRDGPEDDG